MATGPSATTPSALLCARFTGLQPERARAQGCSPEGGPRLSCGLGAKSSTLRVIAGGLRTGGTFEECEKPLRILMHTTSVHSAMGSHLGPTPGGHSIGSRGRWRWSSRRTCVPRRQNGLAQFHRPSQGGRAGHIEARSLVAACSASECDETKETVAVKMISALRPSHTIVSQEFVVSRRRMSLFRLCDDRPPHITTCGLHCSVALRNTSEGAHERIVAYPFPLLSIGDIRLPIGCRVSLAREAEKRPPCCLGEHFGQALQTARKLSTDTMVSKRWQQSFRPLCTAPAALPVWSSRTPAIATGRLGAVIGTWRRRNSCRRL